MYQRIVVGTDGSSHSHDAVQAAGEMAHLCGVDEVHVVAACRPFTGSETERIRSELPAEYRDVMTADVTAENWLAQAGAMLGARSIRMVEHETFSDPAEGIIATAEEIDADLIVVGARGQGAVARFVRGSVSTKVAHHSPCDVLIVEHD